MIEKFIGLGIICLVIVALVVAIIFGIVLFFIVRAFKHMDEDWRNK